MTASIPSPGNISRSQPAPGLFKPFDFFTDHSRSLYFGSVIGGEHFERVDYKRSLQTELVPFI